LESEDQARLPFCSARNAGKIMSDLTPAVFLDRDGTLMVDVNYCNDPRTVQIFPGTAEALARVKAAGFKNIIITNQSGFARGLITLDQYKAVHRALLAALGGDLIDGAYMCPDFASRRKPSPEMVFEAARDLRLDLAHSFFIGDKCSDIECGHNAGTRSIFVQTGCELDGSCRPDFIAKDLAAAVDYILASARAESPASR
jgi:histidinol-phosphate phosphatase family protein